MSDRLITLATFDTAIAAELAKAALADAGIESQLSDEFLVSTVWFLGTGLNGVKLNVRESDAGRALSVYREIEADLKTGAGIDDEELSKQALAIPRDVNEIEEEIPESEQPHFQPVVDTKKDDAFESEVREQIARRLVFTAWVGWIIPGFGFYSLYVFFQAAFGSGTLTPRGRFNLVCGGIATLLSLLSAYIAVELVMSILSRD